MSQRAFEAKSKVLDELEEEFKNNLHEFTSEVKSTIQTAQQAAAIQCFEMAITFLTQAFPNIGESGSGGEEGVNETSEFTAALKKLQSSQKQLSRKVSTLTKNNNSMKDKIEKLNEQVYVNNRQVQEIRKLQKVLETKIKPGHATAPLPLQAPIKSLSQRVFFTCHTSGDTVNPDVFDMKLLRHDLIILVDSNNKFMKLFNTQGQHISSHGLTSRPVRMAVMDSTSSDRWDIAVTLPDKSSVDILSATPTGLRHKKSIATSPYWAIAAVDPKILAVGHVKNTGIDIINLSGHVLRKIGLTFIPYFMEASPDQCLVMTCKSNNFITSLRLVVAAGSKNRQDLTVSVPQVKDPRGITCHPDGTCIVSDRNTCALHLISPDRGWLKTLWSHPGGADVLAPMSAVYLSNGVCVCVTYYGSVFVLDVF